MSKVYFEHLYYIRRVLLFAFDRPRLLFHIDPSKRLVSVDFMSMEDTN